MNETTDSLIKPSLPSPFIFNLIRLNPGISKLNFVCCMLFYVIMIFSYAVPGTLQPMILLDPSYYHINKDQAGTITSLILIIQLVVKIIFSVPYGHSCDKLGRRIMIFFGAFSFLIGCLLVPVMTSLFPGFIFAKALAANSAASFATIPLLADYVADESKGKAAGFLAISIGLAALISNLFVKALLYLEISLGMCYVATGIVVFVALCLNNLGLKGGHYYHENRESTLLEGSNRQGQNISIVQNMMEAIRIFKSNGWLKISLVLEMLGSSDFMVFFTFITIYVKALFPDNTPENEQNIVVNNLQTLVLFPMLFCNLLYGYLLDKKNMAFQISLFGLLGGAVSFILIACSHNPKIWTLSLGCLIFGGTLPGLFVVTNYLGIKNYPQEKRGIMIGLAGLVGFTGYFIIATGGGLLFDHWQKNGPFVVCTALLCLASILIVTLYVKMKRGSDRQGSFQNV